MLLRGPARAGADSPPAPPPIDNVRYTESYAYLRDRDPDAMEPLSPWGSLKYVPLNDAGDVYLTLGAEVRLRYERYHHNNWGEGAQDDDGYLWSRALPLVDVHLGERVRFFGQLIAAFASDLDVPTSPIDENRLDVLQAFADVRLPLRMPVTLRIGRQLLKYGTGRLIDIRYGPNVLRTFDAAKAFVEMDRWRLDAFYARPVVEEPGELDDRTDRRQAVWSVYGTFEPRGAPAGLDLYYIGYLDEDAVFARETGRELRHTVGSRLFGDAAGWDWNFELFYQFGDFASASISAWSVASDTGYTFTELPLRPRAALRANVISGDRDPRDRNVETFNPLFPKGKYFGELTPIGPSNLIHVNPYVSLALTEQVRLSGNVAFYWRESTDDGVYMLGAMELLRPSGGSAERYVGTQAELLLEYQVNRSLSVAASYSIFTAGPFIRHTGASRLMHLLGAEAMYRF
jgi:hypothetical protein